MTLQAGKKVWKIYIRWYLFSFVGFFSPRKQACFSAIKLQEAWFVCMSWILSCIVYVRRFLHLKCTFYKSNPISLFLSEKIAKSSRSDLWIFEGRKRKWIMKKGELIRLESFLLLWVRHKNLCQSWGVDTKLKEELFIENLWTKREVWLLFYMEKYCNM